MCHPVFGGKYSLGIVKAYLATSVRNFRTDVSQPGMACYTGRAVYRLPTVESTTPTSHENKTSDIFGEKEAGLLARPLTTKGLTYRYRLPRKAHAS